MYENAACKKVGLMATCNSCDRIIYTDEKWLKQYKTNGGYCSDCAPQTGPAKYLKTVLPERITTVQQAKKFLTELHKNGEAFHCEDDAQDIVFATCNPTFAEREHLNELMSDIYRLPGNNGPADLAFDPCGFLVDLLQQQKEI